MIPKLYAACWTIDAPGSADRDPHGENQLALDGAVVEVFARHTNAQPWWLGILDRGGLPSSHLIFAHATMCNVVNGNHVPIKAGPDQALQWRDEDGWPHGPLPDVMFPNDRSWLAITGWDDYWMSVGGSAQLLEAFIGHPPLAGYCRQVDYDDPDATPPRHDVWWHHE